MPVAGLLARPNKMYLIVWIVAEKIKSVVDLEKKKQCLMQLFYTKFENFSEEHTIYVLKNTWLP